MRVKSYILFHMDPGKAKDLFSKYGAKIRESDTLQLLEIFKDTDKYDEIIGIMKKNNVDYDEDEKIVYSKKEIDSAELLRILPGAICGYPQPKNDFGYEDISYDKSTACPKCNNGMLQKAPLHIKKPKIGKRDICAVEWIYEYIITERLKIMLEKEGFTGVEYWNVVWHKKNENFSDIYQLFINNVMPKMSSETNIEPSGEKICECGKQGYYLDINEQIKYDRESLKGIKDFNKTSEWLGGMKMTWQLPVITGRVYKFFKENKIKALLYEPVVVIG
jgi:hypothetical protein